MAGTRAWSIDADSVKTMAAITWVGVADDDDVEVRLYNRLPTETPPADKFQFGRFRYFVADHKNHAPGKPVFNRMTGLKDSWKK